jgi:hypothetical protein
MSLLQLRFASANHTRDIHVDAQATTKRSNPATDKGETMTFTQQLYEQISNALPGTTSRSFSRLCGRSEGYFGSINAQQLPISTNSIIYLAEMIEHLIATRDLYYNKQHKLRRIQQMIAEEVARRTQELNIENLPVRKMIISAVAKAAYTRDHQHNLPAIIFG